MLFSANNLSCTRNHKTLFEDISFEITSGQLLLIEGHNGSGKTTLLKLLTGLRRPDSGKILLDNISIDTAGSDFKSQLAWLGHQNPIKNELTAMENLDILGSIRSRNQNKLVDALKTVGLGSVKHKLSKTFSAGMKRRLSLASLLISDCKIWILDEPQAALDKSGIELFEQIATNHLNRGGMIIMTSHHDIGIDQTKTKILKLGLQGE